MTAAAEALIARVYGITVLPVAANGATCTDLDRRHPFNTDRHDRSQSRNLGIPRPMYGLAEDRIAPREEWRGN
jgi:hypothetical protein